MPFGSLADAGGPEGVNRLTPDLGTPCKGHGWKDLQRFARIWEPHPKDMDARIIQ